MEKLQRDLTECIPRRALVTAAAITLPPKTSPVAIAKDFDTAHETPNTNFLLMTDPGIVIHREIPNLKLKTSRSNKMKHPPQYAKGNQ